MIRVRLIWVAMAFVLSGVVAMAVLQVTELYALPNTSHNLFATNDPEERWQIARLVALNNWNGMRGYGGALALAAVIASSFYGIRSWLYFAATGAASLAIVPPVTGLGQSLGGPGAQALVPVAIFSVAGLLAGLSYWLLAGRLRIHGSYY